MKLRNKKTGEIADFRYLQCDYIAPLGRTSYENDKPKMYRYNSLAELNEEWEDEEPKEYWYIDCDGEILCVESGILTGERAMVSIGNHFETRKEAVKAIEKLEAWKRLKDKGFRFNNFIRDVIYYEINDEEIEKDVVREDLDLLFGGEE